MGEEHRVNNSPSGGGTALIIVSVVLSVVQIVFVAARFYTRYMQRMKCGPDDWVMLFALAGSLTKAILYIVLVELAGLGYHLSELSQQTEKVALVRKFFFVLELLDFPLCITPAKISVLLFYVRIFCIHKFQKLVYLVGSLVLAVGITVFFQTIFQCSPIAYGWDQSVGPGTCIDQTVFYRYISPFNVLTGILILALPLPLVWKLQAPKAQKIGLTAVFVLGGLGTVASILRMVIYMLNDSTELSDVTWFSIKLGILTVVDGAVIIIASCLLTICPLIIRLTPQCLLSAISGSFTIARPEHHQCWYMRTRRPSKSEAALSSSRIVNTSREQGSSNWYSSHSSFEDLEDQQLWVYEEGDEIRPCGDYYRVTHSKS
ncbi:hypothetical protein F1880_005661 [Penicillium rolfsii]|nr:hypothetical protein F1880_005661 [Penicillium rolfsii]